MGRTAALGSLAAFVLAWNWLRLEEGPGTRDLFLWVVLLGIVPALLPQRPLRLAAAALAVPLVLREALGATRPDEAWAAFSTGLVPWFEVELPFDAVENGQMHGLVVLAIIGFTLVVSLAIAERRPLLAAGVLAAGAVWPATLLPGENELVRGAVILAVALAIVAAGSPVVRPRQAALAGAAVIAAALGLAGLPAVAKGAFVPWEAWDPYAEPDEPVSVRYVWDTSFGPLAWPQKKTTVFTVEAPPISRYWRATTLDAFIGNHWLEVPRPSQSTPLFDPLAAPESRDPEQLLRAKITIAALRDQNLLGASIPVGYETDLEEVHYKDTGGAFVAGGVPHGVTYTSFSYVARPSPGALARSRPVYSSRLEEYLVVQSRTATPSLPPFGRAGREEFVEELFEQRPSLAEYRPLYEHARRLTAGAGSPYAATVALERWFRSGGGFRYDESPPATRGLPPLVDFVARTQRGYCQYFAGAMALMLRYLGIPARLAAGFTTGSYDQQKQRWTVTDHDAHVWVEVWFRGYGWLPFDPTPGRGDLAGSYSAAAINFNAAAVAAAIAAAAGTEPGDFRLDNAPLEPDGSTGRFIDGRDVPGVGFVTAPRQQSLLRLLLAAAVVLLAGIALLKLGVRRARLLTRDPRRIAAGSRRELAAFLADQRVAVPISATGRELALLLREEAGVNADPFVAALDAARYGPPDRAVEAARRSRRELRRIVRALRRRLTVWERTRGLVSLRSLVA